MSTRLGVRVARVALAGVYVYGGFRAVQDPGDRTEKAARIGFPDDPLVVRLNGAAMVLGGVALALGILPRLAATGLLLSLAPSTVAGHPFWLDDDPFASPHLGQFLKNLGMAGGLLLVADSGRGA